MIQMCEHVADRRGDMRRVFDLLRLGALAIGETPSTDCLDVAIVKTRYWGGYHFPRHFNLFNPTGFRWMLQEEGFEIDSIRPKL
jgi:hypothetical protein